jgi:DNA-binding SARP family transcriptional activator
MEFSILGPLEVREGSRSISIRRGKPAAVLALLVLRRNEVASTEWLIDELWEDGEPRSAAKALQTYVSELRRVLPDGVLETRSPGYVLHVAAGSLDSERFEALVLRARAELAEGRPKDARRTLAEALGLWRGPALADFPYERFAEAERERLDELRLSAVDARIEADLARGAGPELVSELQSLVREHPLREGFTRQLMLALYRAGRQADALERYRESRRILHETLGLEPSRELQDLERAILAQDLRLAAPTDVAVDVGSRRLPRRVKLAAALGSVLIVASAVTVAAIGRPDDARVERGDATARVASDAVRLPFPSVPARLLGEYRARPTPYWGAVLRLTLRPATDPVCTDLLGGDKTCFTLVPTRNPSDPGARGEAAIRDGRICLRYMRVPFSPECVGEIHFYGPLDDGSTFVLAERATPCSFASFTRAAT